MVLVLSTTRYYFVAMLDNAARDNNNERIAMLDTAARDNNNERIAMLDHVVWRTIIIVDDISM